ncbi:aldehyde dehydrogenase family protein, partial [Acidithiobacillus ferrooxidans]|nr:aldehyde dehydrogenase family protein [Acidithiobacillus ferrooxidans]
LYYFDRDQRRALRHCKGIAAGGVTINDTIFHVAQPGIPFGGIGLSGIGQYRGIYGFQRLSHYQGVFRQNRLSACEWVRPPYGRWTRLLIAWLSRWG